VAGNSEEHTCFYTPFGECQKSEPNLGAENQAPRFVGQILGDSIRFAFFQAMHWKWISADALIVG
jgi:hypothetical protein